MSTIIKLGSVNTLTSLYSVPTEVREDVVREVEECIAIRLQPHVRGRRGGQNYAPAPSFDGVDPRGSLITQEVAKNPNFREKALRYLNLRYY